MRAHTQPVVVRVLGPRPDVGETLSRALVVRTHPRFARRTKCARWYARRGSARRRAGMTRGMTTHDGNGQRLATFGGGGAHRVAGSSGRAIARPVARRTRFLTGTGRSVHRVGAHGVRRTAVRPLVRTVRTTGRRQRFFAGSSSGVDFLPVDFLTAISSPSSTSAVVDFFRLVDFFRPDLDFFRPVDFFHSWTSWRRTSSCASFLAEGLAEGFLVEDFLGRRASWRRTSWRRCVGERPPACCAILHGSGDVVGLVDGDLLELVDHSFDDALRRVGREYLLPGFLPASAIFWVPA